MADNTAIEWATHTWSPWTGCTKVSPACDHCYAETWAKRAGHPELWAGERRRTSADYWRKPIKWNTAAGESGERPRVFPSLCDPFDNQVPIEWLADFFVMIRDTPHLDWTLLTKRPQLIERRIKELAELPDGRLQGTALRWLAGEPLPNVWLGTTAENQEEADRRIPHLLMVPAAKRFMSCEPLLGPVHLGLGLRRFVDDEAFLARGGQNGAALAWICSSRQIRPKIDLVIGGGESGPHARFSLRAWARYLRDQCTSADVAFFWKQNGEWIDADEWFDQLEYPPLVYDDRGHAVPWTAPRPLNFDDAATLAAFCGRKGRAQHQSDGTTLIRVGKKAAGRLLDGCEWSEFPA